MTGERELKKMEWLLRGVIEKALILSIRNNTWFIPEFQCLLQAFSLCVSWRHSKPEALATVGVFSLAKEKKK